MKTSKIHKKKELWYKKHSTHSPHMESKARNAHMNPVRKARRTILYHAPFFEPMYVVGGNGYEYLDDENGYNEERQY